MESPPTCDRCLIPLLAYEPYAALEISQRVDHNDESAALDAFGIAMLCHECGEHLQLTSPDITGEEKLCRVATAVAAVQEALDELPRHCQLICTDAIPGQERGGLTSLFPSGSQSRP